MCLYPRLVRNPKYKPNNKNGGNVPEVKDRRALVVPVSCGRCMECRKQIANQWKVRLQEDIKVHTNGKFVTLTFDEPSLMKLQSKFPQLKGYALENAAAVKGVRLFLERWRKKYKKSVRHWLVTELGQHFTERIHIHGIIWTDLDSEISRIWKYGHINIGSHKWDKGKLMFKGEHYCNERSVNYMVKYLHKADPKHKEYRPKTMCSPKIGANYLETSRAKANKYKKNGETKTYYKTPEGSKVSLPMYYKNKIYTEDEREKLWMERLDEQTRYVNGIKVDISKGNEDYFKVLKTQQERNIKLGFGDNTKNWVKQEYEEQRRQSRIDKVRFGKPENKLALPRREAIDKKQDKEQSRYLQSSGLETLKDIF